MGFIDKLKKAIQPDDNDYDGSPDEMYDYDDDPILNNNTKGANHIYSQNNNQNYNQSYNPSDFNTPNGGVQPSNNNNVSIGGPVSSPASLKLVKPKKFDNGKQIANDLLNKKTIIMLLDETENKETARRLVDFMAGVAYAIDGQIKPVSSTMIIFAPQDVDISGMSFDTEKMKRSNSGDDMFD